MYDTFILMVKSHPLFYLYSTSPRRSDLLNQLGIQYKLFPIDVDENIPEGRPSHEVVVIIAMRKLEAGMKAVPAHSEAWGLAADTLVEGPSGLLGKPRNALEAAAMLHSLSGISHDVHTGIAVYSPRQPSVEETQNLVHTTKVTFKNLSDADVSSYIRTGEWKDVAGAYRIQGRGASLVEKIDGLWSTVVGLPLSPLYGILTAMSYPFG